MNCSREQDVVNADESEPLGTDPVAQCACDTNQVKTFRPHQLTAIQAAAQHYLHEDRGQMISPCGTGKTAMAQGIREKLYATSTLVLVPSLILIKQFKEAWQEWQSHPYATMCVCSDKDVLDDEDAVRISLDEIGDVTTDPARIAAFLKRSGSKVIFSTYQSLPRVCEAAKNASTVFDLVVCDEAHRTAGHRDKVFASIHDQDTIRAAKRLYMTATPRGVSSWSRSSGFEADYAYDMDDPTIYGKTFHRMTFKQAIDAKLLADYRIIAVGVSDDELRNWMRDKNHPTFGDKIEDVALNYALNLTMTKYAAKKAITFHSRVSTAADFADRHGVLFPDVFSTHVNGAQSSGQRSQRLQEFASRKLALVSNSRCLVEGLDLPSVDMVFFANARHSTIDVVQATGRALRLDPSNTNKVGLIVVPLLTRGKTDLGLTVSDSPFRNLVNVVRAMSNEDEDLKGCLTQQAVNPGYLIRHGQNIPLGKVQLIGCDPVFGNSLYTQLLDKSVVRWDIQYGRLSKYRDLHPNRWPVNTEEFPVGNKLGTWCIHQRSSHSANCLLPHRIAMLDKIDFPWVRPDAWMTQYLHLQEYRTRHPTRWPPVEAQFPQGNKLGTWCRMQRRNRERHRLLPHRIAMLDKIDFPWVRPDAWMTQYLHLQEYRTRHPTRWPSLETEFPQGNKLGSWCGLHRHLHKTHRVLQDRMAMLNQIDFPWVLSDPWMTQYSHLQEYRKRYPDRWPYAKAEFPEGNMLGSWCMTQRHLYKRHHLTPDRVALLDQINFSWGRINPWMTQYSHLQEYRKRYPDRWPYAKAEFPEGNMLGSWCCAQRSRHKAHRVPPDRVALLNEIGFPWTG